MKGVGRTSESVSVEKRKRRFRKTFVRGKGSESGLFVISGDPGRRPAFSSCAKQRRMSLVTRPFARLTDLDEIARQDKRNVAPPERTASLVAGGILAAAGILTRPRFGVPLGVLATGFLWRGLTGRCGVYRALGLNTANPHPDRGVPGNKGINLEAEEHIRKPAGELFQQWRKLENLPQFLPHVVSVEETDDGTSHWKIRGPLRREWEWDAEIIEEQPGKMLSWQTLPGAAVASAGSVWFEPDSEGTRVKVSLQYQPPAGGWGAAVAGMLGAAPASQVREDLARFKEFMESQA